MKAAKSPKILIVGAYGVDNWGDESILHCILNELRDNFPAAEIRVLSGDPARTTELHGVEAQKFFPIGRGFLRRKELKKTREFLKWADVMILGGGGLFQDHEMRAILLWGMQILAAKMAGKPVFAWAISVGPLRSCFSRALTAWFLKKADFVTVRDRRSYELLSAMGIDHAKMAVTADPAILLPNKKAAPKKKRVLFALRPSRFLDQKNFPITISQFVGFLARKGYNPEFIAMQPRGENADPRFAMQLANNFPVFVPRSINEVVGRIARADVVIGMRLHALIIAATQQVPFMALSYSPKVMSFCHEIGMGDYTMPAEKLTLVGLQRTFQKLETLEKSDLDATEMIRRALRTTEIFTSFVEEKVSPQK